MAVYEQYTWSESIAWHPPLPVCPPTQGRPSRFVQPALLNLVCFLLVPPVVFIVSIFVSVFLSFGGGEPSMTVCLVFLLCLFHPLSLPSQVPTTWPTPSAPLWEPKP